MHNEAFCMVLLTDMVKIGRSRNDLLDFGKGISHAKKLAYSDCFKKPDPFTANGKHISTRGNFMSSIRLKTFEMLPFFHGMNSHWFFFCIVKFSFLSLSPIPRFEPPDKKFYDEEEKNEQSLMEDEQLALHLLGMAW